MKYPTDEELAKFIETLETEPLYAPPFLKESILKQLDELTLPASKQKPKWWQGNFAYNMKVIAGMAAALILIFVLPLDMNLLEWQDQIYEQRLETVINRFENEEPETESELDRLFRISTTTISETGSLIVERLNVFGSLFEKPY